LNAAKKKSGLSWEKIYRYCDSDGNGILDMDELRYAVRSPNVLRVSEHTVNDHELCIFFDELDSDKSGGVALAEVLEYLQRGPRKPEEEEARRATKVARVKKNITSALTKLGSEADIRQKFAEADADGEGKFSAYEFEKFVRETLNLGQWDVKGPDLESFYKQLDTDGDGLEVDELLHYIHNEPLKHEREVRYVIKRPKVPTYHERLLKNCAIMTSDMRPMEMRPSTSFSNLGRIRGARYRLSVSSTPGLLQPGELYRRPNTTHGNMNRAASGPL
jgi:Ca2+-binding EF-hand superfamily protein